MYSINVTESSQKAKTINPIKGIERELDTTLDYWWAKAEIEAKYRTKLVLKLGKLEEKMLEESPRKYMPGKS